MTGQSSAYGRLLDALQQHGATVRGNGTSSTAQCPAHDDRNPSLSLRSIKGSALVYCHAGCEIDDVLAALGLARRDLFDDPKGATYTYGDGRVVHRSPDRKFWQSGNTKTETTVLYHRDRLTGAVGSGQTIFVVEGEKDVRAIESVGGLATCSPMGAGKWGKVDASPLHGCKITVVADKDDAGYAHARDVLASLQPMVPVIQVVTAKEGKDAADHIGAGYGLDDFEPWGTGSTSLADVHDTFARWLGTDYDTDALDAMLAAAAVESLDGDPLWLLLVSGSGNAKTETVQALDGIGATVTSTISSPGALLSATSKRERTTDATGGLLRKLGERGILVVKDVTSILSMNRDMRAEVLGALREVYDGRWSRNVGTDGGRTLDWTGRLVFIGAVTTAWDRAHDVISTMGDRFVLLRMDSTTGRQLAGRHAIGNTGFETLMRSELAEAVAGVLVGMGLHPVELTDTEVEALLAAADLVTLARTGVEYDYRGDVIDAHAPEMPTRFAKQLAQVVRGGVAVGMDRPQALRLAIRCARDSIPPMRLLIVDDLAQQPASTTSEVRRRIGKPRSTVDRQLQALHQLGVLTCDEEEFAYGNDVRTRWRYSLANDIDPSTLNIERVYTRFVSTHPQTPKEDGDPVRLPTDISGIGPEQQPSLDLNLSKEPQ